MKLLWTILLLTISCSTTPIEPIQKDPIADYINLYRGHWQYQMDIVFEDLDLCDPVEYDRGVFWTKLNDLIYLDDSFNTLLIMKQEQCFENN